MFVEHILKEDINREYFYTREIRSFASGPCTPLSNTKHSTCMCQGARIQMAFRERARVCFVD
jgi:hypothetical protein